MGLFGKKRTAEARMRGELEATAARTGMSIADRRAIEQAIEQLSSRGDVEAVIVAKLSLLPGLPASERVGVLEAAGDMYRTLARRSDAVSMYRRALDLGPENPSVLQKLLEVHTEAKEWWPATEAMLALAALARDPDNQARYLFAAAVVSRDELRDGRRAAELFDRALAAFLAPERLAPRR